MLKTRENSDYIPGLKLPDSVKITHDLRDCAEADLVVFVGCRAGSVTTEPT